MNIKVPNREQIILDLFRGAEKISEFSDSAMRNEELYADLRNVDHGVYILHIGKGENTRYKLYYCEYENGDLLLETGVGKEMIYISKNKEV